MTMARSRHATTCIAVSCLVPLRGQKQGDKGKPITFAAHLAQ
eukprot:CAMPEP_0194542416 /NCGR_PEP_ID=MMETSP0253-20130528/83976_1 /TAXON_ID=2966 /ORGANISM="Noctiluca scintillans" /LENGTH=41 /DNA_ID= /DNA_START= /DNA_END= /DNA_ORIENTATION=